jgi:hypothetical protein
MICKGASGCLLAFESQDYEAFGEMSHPQTGYQSRFLSWLLT